MTNILGDDKKQQVLALGRLGWPLRRIEQATGVRRETASAYLKAAGIAIRAPRRRRPPPKPASGVSTDPANPASEVSTDPGPLAAGLADLPVWPPPAGRAPTASACEPYRELIALALGRGRNAMAIWQDLVDDHGFPARYASVRRFVGALRGQQPPVAHPVIVTGPGEEGQVDYGDGPMVRHPDTRKYRRVRLFVFTLGYSRKSVRLFTFGSSARRWAELHEEAFRRLGGAVHVVVYEYVARHIFEQDRPGGTPPSAVKASTWPRRKLSRVWSSAKRAYSARDHESTKTKHDRSRRPPPTGTTPKLPQSTCACSPGRVSSRR
jgi:transposase